MVPWICEFEKRESLLDLFTFLGVQRLRVQGSADLVCVWRGRSIVVGAAVGE